MVVCHFADRFGVKSRRFYIFVTLKNKLKICIVGPAWPLRGGLATFDELFCRSLLQCGHDAEIVSYSLQYPSFLFPGSSQYDGETKAPEGISIHTSINSIQPLSWLSTASYIKKKKPDFIVTRFWIPFMAPALGTIHRLLKNNNIKRIAIADNVIPHEKRMGDKSLTRYFLKSSDGFITMSKSVLSQLNQFVPNKPKQFLLHPLYTSFGEALPKNEARARLNLPLTERVILFFGLVRPYKGLDLLLRSMATEGVRNLNLKLIVAGEFYEDKNTYLEQIRKLGLEKQVAIEDRFIPSEEVRYYFSACDLITLPYRNATQSGVTQVAYHFEKPVLVTDVGGLSETVPHGRCGYVVPPEPESIAEALVDFFQNQRDSSMCEEMKKEKRKFDWRIFSDGIVQFYENILKT